VRGLELTVSATQKESVKLLLKMCWLDTAIKELNNYSRIVKNWDNYGA
jgi:hypothetical protein